MKGKEMVGDVIKLKHTEGTRYGKMLTVVSELFGGLADREKEITILLHAEGGELTSITRKNIRTSLNISEDYLNNYIKKLRDKKVIIDNSLAKNINFKITDKSTQYLIFAFENVDTPTID